MARHHGPDDSGLVGGLLLDDVQLQLRLGELGGHVGQLRGQLPATNQPNADESDDTGQLDDVPRFLVKAHEPNTERHNLKMSASKRCAMLQQRSLTVNTPGVALLVTAISAVGRRGTLGSTCDVQPYSATAAKKATVDVLCLDCAS